MILLESVTLETTDKFRHEIEELLWFGTNFFMMSSHVVIHNTDSIIWNGFSHIILLNLGFDLKS